MWGEDAPMRASALARRMFAQVVLTHRALLANGAVLGVDTLRRRRGARPERSREAWRTPNGSPSRCNSQAAPRGKEGITEAETPLEPWAARRVEPPNGRLRRARLKCVQLTHSTYAKAATETAAHPNTCDSMSSVSWKAWADKQCLGKDCDEDGTMQPQGKIPRARAPID